MVTENAEETEEQSKTDRKANTSKAKAFTQFNNVVNSSCSKLHELFSCQRVAHSVIFYVVIFLLLLVLVYIFRKLVSQPNSNGRKHNTTTTSTGSRNPNDDSLSKGFLTKWPKFNTTLKNFPTNVAVSSDLTSEREKKTNIYEAPESSWQKQEHLSNSYTYKPKAPNSYSSSINNFPKVNQEGVTKQTSANLYTDNWHTSNYVGSNEYGKTPSESSGSSSSGYTNPQYDFSTRGNSGFNPSDSSWKNSWNSASWNSNSNLRSWPYGSSSGSGLTKVNQQSQQGERSAYQSVPRQISNTNNYVAWDSLTKWSQPGSGFGWVEGRENEKENSYKSMTTPTWNSYYYDSASGKRGFNNKDAYAYRNDRLGEKIENSNSYRADSGDILSQYSWNPYAETQTQGWSNFDATSDNAAFGINSNVRGKQNVWNRQKTFTNNGFKLSQETGSSTMQDDTPDDHIHRWPLEDNREDEVPNTLTSHKRKTSKSSRKKHRKVTSHWKNRISQHKLKKKSNKTKYPNNVKKEKKVVKKYKLSNHVKKSVIPRPRNFKSMNKGKRKHRNMKIPKKILSKNIHKKVSRKKKRLSKKKQSKFTRHNSFVVTHKKKKIANKQKHLMGKWQRKVHHVKHCKNLQSFESNGNVHLDKTYLHKQRKYKYTVLSCRYIRIENSRKKHKRYFDDNDEDDFDENGDGVEDEVPLKRKEICRKFWFITNGKILLQKLAKKHGSIWYTVSLCRAKDEHQIRKHNKIVSHQHQTTLSAFDNDDNLINNIDNSRIDKEKENKDFDDNNVVTDQEDNTDKKIIPKLTKHRTHRKTKGHEKDHIFTNDDDSDNDFEIEKLKTKNIEKGTDDNNDNDNFDEETLSDTDDEIDIDTGSKHTTTSKHMIENDENMGELDQENSDNNENDNDFHSEFSAKKLQSHMEKDRYNNRPTKIRTSNKPKQNDNEDDLNEEDIDDIDDNDDNINSDYPKHTKARQRTNDDVTDHNGAELNSDELNDDLSDDIDDDIMYKDHKTKLRRRQIISSQLHKAKNARNRHTSLRYKSFDNKHNINNKNDNPYERVLHELTDNKDTNEYSNVPETLLAAILKKKLNSVGVPKHTISKILQTKSSNIKKGKRKRLFTSHKQKDRNEKALLENMITNSVGVNSVLQAIKRPKKKLPGTAESHTKLPMKDLSKEYLSSVLASSVLDKSTSSPTQKPTMTPTTSDEQMKIQFLKLLKKFGIQNNVPLKTLTEEGSGTRHVENLLTNTSNQMPMHNPTSTASSGFDVTTNKPSSPALSKLPSPPAQASVPTPPPPPPPQQSPPSQQQQQQAQQSPPPQQSQQEQQKQLSQLLTSSPPQQTASTSSTNYRYLNSQTGQEQATVQRSFIPTLKLQQGAQIFQAASSPQSQQQVKQNHGYSLYSQINNNLYNSYQTQKTTNVLCFGDSLTSGYYNHGRGKHPYSIKLNQLLNPQGSHRYHIETRGVVGEMVHGSMTKRLPKVLNEGTHFDWVLILGGTNDVAHVKNFGDDQDFTRQLISVWSPKIVKDIKKLHQIAKSYGARTVLMTIPETAYEMWPQFRSIRNMRLSVNAALRKYATEVRDTTVLCDLAYKLPRSTLSQEMQNIYWNDHIHMNPVGYNKMAEVIQQCIEPYLN